jgi:hypothetical protein
MADYIKTDYVKVKIAGKKSIYLEQVKYTEAKGLKFVSGYEIDKNAESKIIHGGVTQHLIQLGEGREVVPQMMSKTYATLEDYDETKV